VVGVGRHHGWNISTVLSALRVAQRHAAATAIRGGDG
jgi:hypothetical protein